MKAYFKLNKINYGFCILSHHNHHNNFINRNNNIEHSTTLPIQSQLPNTAIYYQHALNFYSNPYHQSHRTPDQHGVTPHGYSITPTSLSPHFYTPSSTIYSTTSAFTTGQLATQSKSTGTLDYPPSNSGI